MYKPRILMLEQPCKEALEIIDEVAERIEPYFVSKNFKFNLYDYVWTGLTPVETDKPVFCPCTGVDHIVAPKIMHLDNEWKKNEGCKVTSTAEHTLSLMLQLAKKSRIQLSGKSVGVIGLGRIGSMVFDICKAFCMDVSYTDITLKEYCPKCIYDSGLNDVFSSNIITLHVPLNNETYHMIGEKEIAMMKPGTLLINTSRQGVVDIDAVKDALCQGKIYYADDFKNEVDLTVYGAIQTPHIAGDTIESRRMTDVYIAKKLQEFIRNRNQYSNLITGELSVEPIREAIKRVSERAGKMFDQKDY